MKIISLAFAYFIFLTPQLASAEIDERINALLAAKNFSEALTEIERGLSRDPDNEQMLLQKGFTLFNLGRVDEARAHYQSLIIRFPDNPEPMNNLGVTYQIQQDFERAINQFNKTITTFPDFMPAYENLGDTYVQLATYYYTAGRSRSPGHGTLVSKADLGQRFHQLAEQNIESAVSRFDAQGSQFREDATLGQNADKEHTASNINEKQITDFLRSWVNAWSGKDTEGYFSHYAEDFNPGNDLNHAQWKARKKTIIDAAEYINIKIKDIEIVGHEVIDNLNERVTLRFHQSYQSNTYQSAGAKVLTLRHTDGQLSITTEESR